jgi:D-3-phosphoglycerate dehydrogenase
LVTEKLAQAGLDALAAAGHEVDVRLGLSTDELLEVMPGAHALVVRSATKVTAAVLAAGTDLVVVGRAGVGVDNVDVEAATTRGVMVVNAPVANILSNAEHTMAMLLAQARNISRADNALRGGRWERSKWEGVELHGKNLAILGLGSVGLRDGGQRLGPLRGSGAGPFSRGIPRRAGRRRGPGRLHRRMPGQDP